VFIILEVWLGDIRTNNYTITIIFKPNNKKETFALKQKRNIKNFNRHFKKYKSCVIEYCYNKEVGEVNE